MFLLLTSVSPNDNSTIGWDSRCNSLLLEVAPCELFVFLVGCVELEGILLFRDSWCNSLLLEVAFCELFVFFVGCAELEVILLFPDSRCNSLSLEVAFCELFRVGSGLTSPASVWMDEFVVCVSGGVKFSFNKCEPIGGVTSWLKSFVLRDDGVRKYSSIVPLFDFLCSDTCNVIRMIVTRWEKWDKAVRYWWWKINRKITLLNYWVIKLTSDKN